MRNHEIFSFQLKKDFEEDKQQAVSRALMNTQREIDRAKRQAEEKSKEMYMEEMKKLAQKHKQDISATKKKQWVSTMLPESPSPIPSQASFGPKCH